MSYQLSQEEVQEVLSDLHRYLSDQSAPLIVADSIGTLLDGDPELIATGVHQWALAEIQLQPDWMLAELFFHALKKLNDMGELHLVSDEGLADKLREAGTFLIDSCPENEREHLASILPRLGHSMGPSASGISVLHRPNVVPGARQRGGAGAGAAGGAVSSELSESLHRFSLLLSRLGVDEKSQSGGRADGAFLPHLMTLATKNARDPGEIDRQLEKLRELGIEDATSDKILSSLSERIPNWVLTSEEGVTQPDSSPVAAMHKVVSLEKSSPAYLERIAEMLRVGTEQFNLGAVARAITIFELINRLADEKKFDPRRTRLMLDAAHEEVDTDRLHELVEKPESHGLLRKVLRFFPAFRPNGLLSLLEDEPDRQRRRLFIKLVLVHGQEGREACLARMTEYSGAGDLDHRWHILRNLVHILRQTPGELTDDQLEVVIELSELSHPPKLIREALEYLGSLPVEETEYQLMKRLYELEQLLDNPTESTIPLEDVRRLMDVISKDLIGIGTTRSRRAVIESCLKQTVYKSDATARLGGFGAHDLATEPDLIKQLVHRLRKELPSKLLGRIFKRDDETVLHLVQALSGTTTTEVQALLGEIAGGYADHPFAAAANAAISGRPSPAKDVEEETTAAFSGDLDLFGVPNLLQNISDNTLDGRLVLFDRNRERVAQLYVEKGSMTSCSLARLKGAEAFFQMLENPFPGTFEFSKTSQPDPPDEGGPWSMIGVLMEGMRRYDEVEMMRAVLPDDVPLQTTGKRPTPAPGEEDGSFIRNLWEQVKSGATPIQCEVAVAVDSYRSRTLLAHWIQEGALQIAGE